MGATSKKNASKAAMMADPVAPAPYSLSGAPFSSVQPIYDLDERHMYLCALDLVQVYHMDTGDHLQNIPPTFDDSRLAQRVTATLLPPAMPGFLITGNSSGMVRVWRIADASLQHEVNVGAPVVSLIYEPQTDDILIGASTPKTSVNYALKYVEHLHKTKGMASLPHYKAIYADSQPDGPAKASPMTKRALKAPKKGILTHALADPPAIGGVFQWSLRMTPKGHFSGDINRISTIVRHIKGIYLHPEGQLLLVLLAHAVRFTLLLPGPRRTVEFTDLQLKAYDHLNCLAFHPTEPTIALGTTKGRLDLWTNALANVLPSVPDAMPIRSMLNWHSVSVDALAFTSDGALLLSGGPEAVLVAWQLRTEGKTFLPRLGGGITHIAITPEADIAHLALADNSIAYVNLLESRITRLHIGLRRSGSTHATQPLRIATDSGSLDRFATLAPLPKAATISMDPSRDHPALLIPSAAHPGSLQLWEPERRVHLLDINVLPRTASGKGKDGVPIPGRVSHTAFTPTGSFLITVDEPPFPGEHTLRFWSKTSSRALKESAARKSGPPTPPYICQASIESPHRMSTGAAPGTIGSLVALAVSPAPPRNGLHARIATSGTDGRVRIWDCVSPAAAPAPVKGKSPATPPLTWTCHAVLSHRADDEAAGALAFSPDGSVLAASFGQTITLWDPEAATLRDTLPVTLSPAHAHVLALQFIHCPPTPSGAPRAIFLAILTQSNLLLWNLLLRKAWWGLQLDLPMPIVPGSHGHWLTPLPLPGHFALLHNMSGRKFISIFPAHSAVPIAVRPVPQDSVSIIPAHEHDPTSLYVLTVSSLFRCDIPVSLASSVKATTPSAKASGAQAKTHTPTPALPETGKKAGKFASLVGRTTVPSASAATPSPHAPSISATRDILHLLDIPAHLAPPVTRTFPQYISHLLVPVDVQKEDEEDEETLVEEADDLEDDLPQAIRVTSSQGPEETTVRREESLLFDQVFSAPSS